MIFLASCLCEVSWLGLREGRDCGTEMVWEEAEVVRAERLLCGRGSGFCARDELSS